MKKLAILFNTLVKLQTYDFESLKDTFDFIAVVSKDEFEKTKNEFGSTFKAIINFEEAERTLQSFISKYNEVRFICLSEDNLLFTAQLREKFNIEGMRYKTAILFRDKIEMKKILQKNGVEVPNFGELSQYNNFSQLKQEFGLPFVVKPKDAFGSKDVSIINNEEQYNKLLKTEGLECESFIKGKLYHIDNIWQNGKAIFEVCNEYSCPNEEFRKGKALLSMPLLPENEVCKQASILAKKVIDIFELKTGATHLEFFVSNNGKIIFLEVAGRTPGAVIVPMYNKQFDFNLPNIDLLNHFGLLSDAVFERKINAFSGIFPNTEGVVRAIKELKILSQYNIEVLTQEGEKLEQAQSLRDIAAKIIAFNKSFEVLYEDFKEASNFSPLINEL